MIVPPFSHDPIKYRQSKVDALSFRYQCFAFVPTSGVLTHYFSRWFRDEKKAFPLEKGFLKRTDQIAGLSRFSSCPFSPGPVGRNGHQTYGKTGDRRSHDDGDHRRDSILYDLWW
jgi:hypothetical protein